MVNRAALLLKLINLSLGSTGAIGSSLLLQIGGLYHTLLFLLKLANLLLSRIRKRNLVFLYAMQLWCNVGLLLKQPDIRFEPLCSCGFVLCHLNQIGMIIEALLAIFNSRFVSEDSSAGFIALPLR